MTNPNTMSESGNIQQPTNQYVGDQTPQQNNSPKNRNLWIIIGIVVAVVLLGVAGFFLLNKGDDKTDPTSNASTEAGNNTPNNETPSVITEEYLRSLPANPASDFEYGLATKNTEEIQIRKYIGKSDVVVIPETIDGKPVTEIKGLVFANESFVRAVYFPNTITTLDSTFGNSKSIELVIAEGLEELGEGVFLNCSVKTIVLGQKVKKMRAGSVSNCSNLETLIIPSDPILDNYFRIMGCPKLTIIGVNDSSIHKYATENNIPFIAK